MDGEIRRRENQVSKDEVFIEDFQAGRNPREAFDHLILKYRDKIFNLCYRFLGNYAEADDTAQEVFLKAFCSLKNFRFESAFATWLYRIAVNTCKNKLLSADFRYKKKMVYLDNPVETPEGDCQLEIKDESLSPVKEIEGKEREKFIQSAIDGLPEDQKKVVILRDIDGLSYAEISAVTGLNLGTVKSKLARAREALAEKLRRLI